MQSITVPKGHRCPLCPGHQDEENEFAWSSLLRAPICIGCTYDIHNGLIYWDDRPTLEQYNHADTIERLEQLTVQSFHQLKFRYLKELIEEITGSTPAFLHGIAFQDRPDSELRILSEKLDYELVKLRVAEDAESYNPIWKDKFENTVKADPRDQEENKI